MIGTAESPIKRIDKNAKKAKMSNRNSTRLDSLSESYGIDSINEYGKTFRESTGTIGEKKKKGETMKQNRPLPELQT
jgi:hypothetical protein